MTILSTISLSTRCTKMLETSHVTQSNQFSNSTCFIPYIFVIPHCVAGTLGYTLHAKNIFTFEACKYRFVVNTKFCMKQDQIKVPEVLRTTFCKLSKFFTLVTLRCAGSDLTTRFRSFIPFSSLYLTTVVLDHKSLDLVSLPTRFGVDNE